MVFTITLLLRSNAVMVKSGTNQEKYCTHLFPAAREKIAIALEQDQSLRSIAESPEEKPLVCQPGDKAEQLTGNKAVYRGDISPKRAENRSRHSHAKERLTLGQDLCGTPFDS
jgi:hypothetical protein